MHKIIESIMDIDKQYGAVLDHSNWGARQGPLVCLGGTILKFILTLSIIHSVIFKSNL